MVQFGHGPLHPQQPVPVHVPGVISYWSKGSGKKEQVAKAAAENHNEASETVSNRIFKRNTLS